MSSCNQTVSTSRAGLMGVCVCVCVCMCFTITCNKICVCVSVILQLVIRFLVIAKVTL